jgi:PAS domain S-box-containing protein
MSGEPTRHDADRAERRRLNAGRKMESRACADSDRPHPHEWVVASRRFHLGDATAILRLLTGCDGADDSARPIGAGDVVRVSVSDEGLPMLDARYRALLEQTSAVVFTAHLDCGVAEVYVSPHIESALGFSRQEWLEDPVRWYAQIHPDEKVRCNREVADMLATGAPLRSVYRVHAKDGHVVWFQCEASILRRDDGSPWFIQGVGFDISELKRVEGELQEERRVLSAILDTVGALVIILDQDGRIVRFNRACERMTGYALDDVRGRDLPALFLVPEEAEPLEATLAELRRGLTPGDCEIFWTTPIGAPRQITWSSTALPQSVGPCQYVIATGIDVTERRRLQKTILEVSDRQARRIGQDLHDGLGQHLTGIAFLSKVLEQKLAERRAPETVDADKILGLVNEAINKTRELARGLLSVVSEEQGLVSALRQIAMDVEDLFKISCRLEWDGRLAIDDLNVATHLCHIAREAVNNAIKHGRARHITIELTARHQSGTLAIRNDGAGFPVTLGHESGVGLHIMKYRAGMIGGTLQIEGAHDAATVIRCQFPVDGGNRRGGAA